MEARQFYEETILNRTNAEGETLFDTVHRIYPEYNTHQAPQATDYMIHMLAAEFGEQPYWSEIEDELYEMIIAGLT